MKTCKNKAIKIKYTKIGAQNLKSLQLWKKISGLILWSRIEIIKGKFPNILKRLFLNS